MNRTDSRKNIIEYYQSSQWMYCLFVFNNQTLGMHFGFWNKTTKNRHEAILNENQEVIRAAGIHTGQRVLDAGCGVGGTVLYIAQTTGASVWGISLDPKQITIAKRYAQKRGVASSTHFSVQDYTYTNFPDNYFDVVFGIESICHASSKRLFLREAYRILKPGGKLVIMDGYPSHLPITPEEKRILADFTQTFALPPMTTNEKMMQNVSQEGFIRCTSKNMFKKVIPSVKYFSLLIAIMRPICIITQYIPIEHVRAIYRNYLALKSTREMYRIGLADYWIQYAQKPK